MIRKLMTLLILLSFSVTAGCPAILLVGAAAAGGAAGYAYVDGELKKSYAEPMEKIHSISLKVLEELKIKLLETYVGLDDSKIIGETTEGKKIRIRITKEGPEMSRVGVRSGFAGVWDKNTSELIHAEITNKLK